MEEYEEMGNDACDLAFDGLDAPAITTTPMREDHEGFCQSGQMVSWVAIESESNGGSRGVLKATSGNATKKLKTRTITRAWKSAQAIIMKQIAVKEHQTEIGQMKK